jgi:predicted RND superfamily exporter protein
LIALIVTLVAGWRTSMLVLDPDLRRLMPPDDPVVHELETLDRAFGTISVVTVLVEGGNAEAREAFAEAMASSLSDDPLIREVRHRVESEYFADRALYYLDPPRFDTLRERTEAWRHFEFCSRAPGICTLEPDSAAREALRTTLEELRTDLESRTRFRRYFHDPERGALAFFIRPRASPHDFEASEAVERLLDGQVKALLGSPGPWTENPLEISLLGGHVVNPREQRILVRDVGFAGAIGLAGIIVVLSWVFRSARALIVLSVPLLSGLALALGVAQLWVGHLNALTGMISTVIVGMGIDAGIHLLARVRAAARTRSLDDALESAFAELAAPLLVATTTTLGAFIIIATSSYPLFFEFGLVAALGVAACLMTMFTVFPALVMVVGVAPTRSTPQVTAAASSSHFPSVAARAGLFAVVAITAAGILGDSSSRFERDGRQIQSDSLRADRLRDVATIMDLFGTVPFPALLRIDEYADYATETVRMNQALQERREAHERQAGPPSLVGELVALPDLLPPDTIDLEARRDALLDMSEDFDDETWAQLAEASRELADGEPGHATDALTPQQIDSLRRMFDADPPAVERLPDAVRSRFEARDGERSSWVVFAYPNFDATDVFDALAFTEELRGYAGARERPFAGEPVVLATMYESLESETPPIVMMASALAIVLVWAQVRSLGWTVVSLAPVLLGVGLMIALMPFTGVRFTLLNVPVVPAIVGIAVDNGVYVVAALRSGGSDAQRRARVRHTGRTVFASAATTIVGFAALLTADSGGVQSIGAIATLGLSCAAAVALLSLFALSPQARR